MKQSILPVSGEVTVQVENVGGDLQIVGWERPEVVAKSDHDQLSMSEDGSVIHVQSSGDLILYVAREVTLKIFSVGGDADLRALSGAMEIKNIGGDLQMRNVGSLHLKHVGGDMSMRGCSGELMCGAVGGDASLHDISGDVKITVGADLYLRGSSGNVQAQVGADAALYLNPILDKVVDVKAGSDILLRLPVKPDVELNLEGCDDESIRVDMPGVERDEVGMFRNLKLGKAGSLINLRAGSEVIVTSRDEEWENVAEFDPLGRDGPFSAGEFPGLSSDMHERISRRVEEAARHALEASLRAQEQSDKVQRRVDSAMRRAEEKMRSSERRSMHMGIKVGRFGADIDTARAPIPSMSPSPLRPTSEPVTDAERLTILKMLQAKKITLQDAEKLLSALDGK